MIRPGLDEFRTLARTHTVIPVWRELLADLTTPVAAYARLVGDGTGFLLESVEHGEARWSRWSFVGRNPLATLTARGLDVEVTGSVPDTVPCDRGILAALEALLDAWHAPALPDLPPLHGGVLGYLGYDVVREVEHLPDVPKDDQGHADAVVSVIGQLAAYDHWRQRVVLIENVLVPDGASDEDLATLYDAAVGRLDELAADGARPLDELLVEPPTGDDELPAVTSTMGSEMYGRAVEVAREHIVAGDIFQVVLAQRFDFDLGADPFDFYRVLRQVNPSPYMYLVRFPEVTLVGSSPEPMVQLLENRVISRPIAGTRRRGSTEEHDRRMAAELL
ncbi:MAG TPA: chorismate-binding protein, partial [Acidimicrobiales bacterium]|nr:chorismate-binding protein [Acidimicrobiales bacterium]